MMQCLFFSKELQCSFVVIKFVQIVTVKVQHLVSQIVKIFEFSNVV